MKSDKYQIIKDTKYGYLRVDPIPKKQEVDKYYAEEFYAAHKKFNDSEIDVQLEQKDFFNSKWAAVYKRCLKYFKDIKGKSLFDIGFGYAQALLYLRDQGLDVSGLEPAPEGVEYARKNGLRVFKSGIEDLSCVGSRRFDIVTSFNVLEHLRFPADMLIKIKGSLLKKDGLLVVDVANEFNDLQTVANSEFGLKEWWLCPPNHINYFSVDSISRLISQCGYKVLWREASFPLEIFLLMGDAYVGNSGI